MSRLPTVTPLAGAIALVTLIRRTTPALPGARCVASPALFDPASESDEHAFATDAAKRLCATCPALADCRRWLDGMAPGDRPSGVVAGTYWPPSATQPRGPKRSPSATQGHRRSTAGRDVPAARKASAQKMTHLSVPGGEGAQQERRTHVGPLRACRICQRRATRHDTPTTAVAP